MQIKLPIFPFDSKMIGDHIAVKQEDYTDYYFHSGMPIFTHEENDLNQFRYITSNFIDRGLCRSVDIERGFHVSSDLVRRSLKKFREKGLGGFVEKDGRRGRAHKMLPDRLARIQKMIDQGYSNVYIAKQEGISERSIRYMLGKGELKKSK